MHLYVPSGSEYMIPKDVELIIVIIAQVTETPFNPYNNPMSQTLLFSQYFGWEYRGLEELNALSEVTQLESGRAAI